MNHRYRRIGPVRRGLAALLALILLPAIPLGILLVVNGEWFGGVFALFLGVAMGGAMVFAAVTGRSPEQLKDALYSAGLWSSGS